MIMRKPGKVLAISPHADDVELGAAGLLLKLIHKGWYVQVVVCSLETEVRYTGITVSGDTRRKEFYESMSFLGAYGIEHNGSITDKKGLISALDRRINSLRPDIVLIPAPSFHQDHQFVYDCCLAATRPTKGFIVPTVLVYEYPASNWGPSAGMNPARGGIYEDISSVFQLKLESLRRHKSQIHDRNHMISLDGVTRLAKFRGMEIGVGYAELFYLLRSVNGLTNKN